MDNFQMYSHALKKEKKKEVSELTKDELKSIIGGWHKLLVLCSILFFKAIVLVLIMIPIFMNSRYDTFFYIFTAMILLFILASVGTLLKKSWGRILGLVVCYPMLFGVPIGTLVGIIGLMGYSSAKPLFGEGGLKYSEVVNAYKQGV